MIWLSTVALAGLTDAGGTPLISGSQRRAGHAVGDFDGDGQWDFVYGEGQEASGSTPSHTYIRFGDGRNESIRSGGPSFQGSGVQQQRGFLVADFDHDGDEDILEVRPILAPGSRLVGDGAVLVRVRTLWRPGAARAHGPARPPPRGYAGGRWSRARAAAGS